MPRITWRQDKGWHRGIARACDDLADDIEHGQWPTPTCAAEELVLHLTIEDAPSFLDTTTDDDTHASLPKHPDDYTWDTCSDLFFQDHDILWLYDEKLDGIEDPDGDLNQALRVGDLRPVAWFRPFGNVKVRDPNRGFRR